MVSSCVVTAARRRRVVVAGAKGELPAAHDALARHEQGGVCMAGGEMAAMDSQVFDAR